MTQDIFPYYDGAITRKGDPFTIERVLNAYCDGDVEGQWKKARSNVAEMAVPAMARVIQAVCAAFKMPHWDDVAGTGTPEETVLQVFTQFLDYRQKKKLSAATSQTLLPATDWVPPLSSLENVDWKAAMDSLMDCGCTGAASGTSEPTKSS